MTLMRLRLWMAQARAACTLRELSGSFGDLGTLLPIITAMAVSGQISLTATLVLGGLWNVLSGWHFGIPICVQPMKAIAAVALARNLSPGEVSAAGITVGAVVFLLGASGLITWVARTTPPCIVKGIQLGTGLILCTKAAAAVLPLAWGGADWRWWDNYEWALLALLLCFAFYRQPRVPLALCMFLVGLTLSLTYIGVARSSSGGTANPPDWPSIRVGDFPPPAAPTPAELLSGFLKAGLGQLPLTTLNSVVALVHLAGDLFPERRPLSPRHVAMSVGAMNLIGCFFGSVPYCHGSGGLAGQYRFGARTGASVCMLGALKIAIGLLFGSTLTSLLALFPQSLLGVMLFISGAELACSARTHARRDASEAEQRDSFTTLVMTAGMLIAFKHDGVGFLAGIASYVLLRFQRLREERSRQSVPSTPPSESAEQPAAGDAEKMA